MLLVQFQVSILAYNSMYLVDGVNLIRDKRLNTEYVCQLMLIENICIRYLMFMLQRQHIARLMDKCQRLWTRLKSNEVWSYARPFERRVYFYRNFSLVISYLVIVLFVAGSQLTHLAPDRINGTARRKLPYSYYYDVQEDPDFSIISGIQGLILCYMAIILAGIDTIAPFLIMLACGYSVTLKNRLLNMAHKDDKSTNVNNQLIYGDVIECAKFHREIMSYCQDIENHMRSFHMVIMICNVYNMSLIGIQILQNIEYFFQYSSLLAMHFMQLYLSQWAPDHLLHETKAIGNAAYFATLGHSIYNHQANKILQIMMLRAHCKPVQLTAGGYIKLSMETFGKVNIFLFSIKTFENFNAYAQFFSDDNQCGFYVYSCSKFYFVKIYILNIIFICLVIKQLEFHIHEII
uniref:Odorant receptor n=1 Tax=Trichogramma kaykai TaxID=54128 RepID=A0ABD2W8J1_9HYME